MIQILCSILGMLLLERVFILSLCNTERGRGLIRACKLLHPNTLSCLRLPMGCVSVYLAYRGDWCAATLFFAFWMITDLSDGTIARRCDLGTETGKWLDPLSDKCMYFPVLLFFCFSTQVRISLSLPMVLSFIVIDLVGQFSRLFARKKAANMFGKAKTAMVTILLALLALNQITPLWLVTEQFTFIYCGICLLLAFLSLYCKVIPNNWYANSFTLMNFICGVVAIYYAFQQKPIFCLLMVFLGQFFDLFDGRLARKFGSTKGGPMFDDIADATSFGLGIGSLVYVTLDKLEVLIPKQVALIIAIFYIGCLIYRLYRFLKPTMPLPPGIFQGLPSPAGAMFAGSALLVSQEFSAYPWTGVIAAFLVVAASLLMISNVRYAHFGQVIWPATPKFIRLLFFLFILLLSINAFSHKQVRPFFIWCCFLLTLFYLVYGMHRINRLPTPQKHAPAPEDTHL